MAKQLPLAGSFEIFMHTEVTDSVTGFTGHITARCEWESDDGERTYQVTDTNGKTSWFPEDRIRPPAQVVTPTPIGVTTE